MFKVVFAISACVICGIANVISTLGVNKDEPSVGVRYWLLRLQHHITSRIVIFAACGSLVIRNKKPDVCYKKYLGQDWEPDYDLTNCGSVISNHTSFLDSPLFAMV